MQPTTRRNSKEPKSLKRKATSILKVGMLKSKKSTLANAFEKSIDMYTEAIFCKIPPSKKSVYFCNRALSNLKLENFAVALFDACESVKHDKTNVKGYYRRAQSYYAMRQLKNSMNDFKTVCKM